VTVQQEATQGVILTDVAASKVSSLLAQEGRDDLRLRIAVQPGGCSGLRYQLYFDERDIDGDIVSEFGSVEVVTDKMSAPLPDGRDDRLRRHDREAGLHDRQPERDGFLRLRRFLPLTAAGGIR
jgi:iron-sulfur cluster assembly accessory protein